MLICFYVQEKLQRFYGKRLYFFISLDSVNQADALEDPFAALLEEKLM